MPTQPTLGARAKQIIEVDGLKFRDLDGDGQLSPYEDWRLPVAERVADLVGRMTDEEKAGLMIIGSHYPGYSEFLPHAEPGRVLNPEDVWRDANPITGQAYPEPVLVTSSTDNAVNVRHQRFLICRDNLAPEDLATWTNAVQEVAEASRLGIPVVFASNPRNHVALVAEFGVNESTGVFSEWPSELGLAALQDPELMERFGVEIAKEWRAGGLHKLYGYMADVASEPRWSRFNGTFGEDTDLVTEYIRATVTGMQGPELTDTSVACTIKHFPGGGVRLDGHDPHFEWGQTNEYPTEDSLSRYHLPPFQAAFDAGVSSVMPYYAKPVNSSAPQLPEADWFGPTAQFDEVAFAYNETFLCDLLRRQMRHGGYVNSDSGVIDAMYWGVEELTRPERFARAIKAGTDVFSDMSDPAQLLVAVSEGLVGTADLDTAVSRLLSEIFALGLFENPYVDEQAAGQVIGNAEVSALGQRAQRESVTLLRHDAALLPLDPSRPVRVFPYVTGRTKIDEVQGKLEAAIGTRWPGATVVDTPEEADLALVWARPAIALFEDDREGVSLSVDPRNNGVDVDRVREIERAVPTILLVNVTNPWLLGEIEPDAAAVVATFEITPENLLASLAGEGGGPAGRLPLTMPVSPQAIADSPRDVPGKFLDDDYVYRDRDGVAYAYGHGIRF
ncbi:glycoside hydrolase family 3 protein [Corynebacterium suedekumii]|uniref:beta-glucosidase n=1 Tax=Corynebacterium suedekumii TaxID=3049801 RepID=A0ABY8VNF2_9CORY|nr:glycoside hydrolase family 3 N-terminal domain-containing protein [Corynebacterium suedekumii]WIM71186.1 glycoside hydrolase family 3 N-terminal domain-containing protein [Corynebacterium suedekumii]